MVNKTVGALWRLMLSALFVASCSSGSVNATNEPPAGDSAPAQGDGLTAGDHSSAGDEFSTGDPGDNHEAGDSRVGGDALSPAWRDWTSGTRIKARVMVTPTGAEERVGWFDTTLGINCEFRAVAGGQARCLPVSFIAVSQIIFTDAACTQPMVYLTGSTDCSLPTYAMMQDSSTCPATSRFFEVGAELAPTDPVYRQLTSSDPCEEIPQLSTSTYFHLGDEVVDTDFVGGPVATDVTGVGITVETITADDGTVAPWRWLDTTTELPCSLARADDGQWRCLPGVETSAQGAFADAGCNTWLARDSKPASCPAPTYARVKDNTACGSEYPVYGVGAQVGGTVYFEYGTSCNASSSQDDRFFAREAVVDPSPFVAATEIDGFTRGRLTEKLLDIGGVLQQRRFWYDNQLAVPCGMARISSDGTHRCLPEVVGVSVSAVYHANSPCTTRLIQSFSPCNLGYAWSINLGTCPPQYGVIEVGDRYNGVVYSKVGGLCSQNTVALPFPLYRVGAAIDSSELVPAVEVLR